jgi:hypothetical protein
MLSHSPSFGSMSGRPTAADEGQSDGAGADHGAKMHVGIGVNGAGNAEQL